MRWAAQRIVLPPPADNSPSTRPSTPCALSGWKSALQCLRERRGIAVVCKAISVTNELIMAEEFKPHNPYLRGTLTDLYQLTMSYAYWVNGKHDQRAVYDLFFRKCPFKGQFTIFAGLEECVRWRQW